MKLSLVAKVIVGFSTVLIMQLLMTALTIVSQSKVSDRFSFAVETNLPLLQQSSLMISYAQKAALAVSQHAAETDPTKLPNLEKQYRASIDKYFEHAALLKQLARDHSEQSTIEEAIEGSKGAFDWGEKLIANHRELLTTTEAEYQALRSFEDSWQYFSADLNDTLFVLTEKELPAKWLLDTMQQDANEAAIWLTRVPSYRTEEQLQNASRWLKYFWGNVEVKHKLMQERFPVMVEKLNKYVALLDTHINHNNGVLHYQVMRLNLIFLDRSITGNLVHKLDDSIAVQEQLNNTLRSNSDLANRETTNVLGFSRSLVIGTFLVSLVVGIVIATLVVVGVRGPLAHLVRRLEHLSNNDFTDRIKTQTSGEFFIISRSLDKLVKNLSAVIRQIKSQSGKLSEYASESDDMSRQSRLDIDQQKEQTQTLAAAATQMDYTAKNVAENARNASGVVNKLFESASGSHKNVQHNRDLIASLDRELSSAANVIQELRDQSENIDSIVSVILGIVEQTNLLALNAAIEAARAGEQGRGFAVVADEVRALANKTRESTSEITFMIESLQSKTVEANQIMQRSQAAANSCVKQSDITTVSLQSIIDGLDNVRSLSVSIATAAEEQSHFTSDLAQSVVVISKVTEGIHNRAVVIEESSAHLSELASVQNNLTEKFKLS